MSFWRKYAFALVFVLLVAGHEWVVLTTRLLPFVDLPNHLAAATIVRHYGDPGNAFDEYFSVRLFPKPNVAHLLFCRSPIFPSVEFANRVYYGIVVLLLPLSTWFLIRRVKGCAWWTLLSFPLLYHHGVTWGFAGFSLAVPLVLLAVGLCAGLDRASHGRSLALSAVLTLLFFIHLQAALFAILLFLVIQVSHDLRRPGRLLRDAWILLPFVLLVVLWQLAEEAVQPELLDNVRGYFSERYVAEFPLRFALLFHDNSPLYAGIPGELVGLGFGLVILLTALLATVRLKRALGSAQRRGPIAFALAFLGVALVCCLVLPSEIPGQWNICQRMGVFGLLACAVLAAASFPATLPRAAIVFLVALCGVHWALWADYFQDFRRDSSSFSKGLLPHAAPGERLAGLIYANSFRGHTVYVHFPSYHIVWSRGIASTSLCDYRFANVRRKVTPERLPPYDEWVGRTGRYDGRYRDMDYLLVRGRIPKSHRHELAGFEPVESRGPWRLLRRRRPAR